MLGDLEMVKKITSLRQIKLDYESGFKCKFFIYLQSFLLILMHYNALLYLEILNLLNISFL